MKRKTSKAVATVATPKGRASKQQKKEKKAKTPAELQRPVSAYGAFFQDRREAIDKELAKEKFVDSRGKTCRLITIQARAKEQWKQLPDNEKQVYRDRQSEALKKHKSDVEKSQRNQPGWRPSLPKKPANLGKARCA